VEGREAPVDVLSNVLFDGLNIILQRFELGCQLGNLREEQSDDVCIGHGAGPWLRLNSGPAEGSETGCGDKKDDDSKNSSRDCCCVGPSEPGRDGNKVCWRGEGKMKKAGLGTWIKYCKRAVSQLPSMQTLIVFAILQEASYRAAED